MSPPTTRRYRTAAGTPRRRPRVRRASARLSPMRSGAILAMLISAGAVYGLATTSAVGFDRLEIQGNVVTPDDTIREQVAVEPGTNLVGLATQPIVERLLGIPSIGGVAVGVGLPDVLRIAVTERRPVVLWGVGAHRFAVDESGLIFADVGTKPPEGVASLPVVTDQRTSAVALGIRSILDPVDLDAALRLGSLTPDQIGSHAPKLGVTISDEKGFTVGTGPKGWSAVFGFYGRSQRTPALIPGQVQLLASLLAGREDTIQSVVLGDDRDGTYIPKPTPKPSARPSASPRP
ncbi:MAG TPA: FtsQ-type POTRA domain-containing protein [Candidatus Limnocylindrales bacterium]